MTDLYIILALMFLCHLIADFSLQGWLAKAKSKYYEHSEKNDYIMALICHGMMWGIMIYLPIFFLGEIDFEYWLPNTLFWLGLPINIVVHILIDNLKANKHAINLIEDQLYHFLQIALTWLFYFILLVIY